MSQSIADLIKQKKQELEAKNAAYIRTIKPADGTHTYRILPGWRVDAAGARDPQFWHEFGQHYIKSSPKGKPEAVYICTEATFNKPCDVCAAIASNIRNCEDDATLELLSEAKAPQRYLLNVLHRSGSEPNKVQVLEVGGRLFESILSLMEEWGDITDLASGKDIKIVRSGAGLNTVYSVLPAASSQPVPTSVLSQLNNLDAMVSQENPAKAQITLTALAKIVGIMPPSGAATAALTAAQMRVPDLTSAEDAAFEPVSDPTVTATSLTATDAELDDLLAELGTGT